MGRPGPAAGTHWEQRGRALGRVRLNDVARIVASDGAGHAAAAPAAAPTPAAPPASSRHGAAASAAALLRQLQALLQSPWEGLHTPLDSRFCCSLCRRPWRCSSFDTMRYSNQWHVLERGREPSCRFACSTSPGQQRSPEADRTTAGDAQLSMQEAASPMHRPLTSVPDLTARLAAAWRRHGSSQLGGILRSAALNPHSSKELVYRGAVLPK